jgi:hypothetical protein
MPASIDRTFPASGAADPWLKEVENWQAKDLENIIESHRLGN